MLRKKILFIFILISFLISFMLLMLYINNYELKYLMFSLLGVFISCSLVYCLDLKKYIIHLFFTLCIFMFLFCRPLIDYFRYKLFFTYQVEAYVFAFSILFISLISMLIGALIYSKLIYNKKNSYKLVRNIEDYNLYIKYVRIVSACIFAISYPFYVIRIIEKVIFKFSTDYYTYYAEFKSELPYFTYIISTFLVYAMCVFLATKPKKIYSTIVLFLYAAANTMHLLIGTRNIFILSVLFAFMYYFFRNNSEQGKWIGIKEKIAIVVLAPAMVLFMGILNYVRDGSKVTINFLDLIIDFMYKQGTSFGVLAKGYIHMTDLPVKEFTNFTFGPIIEYFQRGSIGIYLFDQKPFQNTGNSIELAIQSNSYSHNISYIDMGSKYLEGHGIGSSYIIELFTDYGIIGVIIANILLGMLFVWIAKTFLRERMMPMLVSLIILLNLFFMPRSSLSESFFTLFTMQFWSIVIFIIFISRLIYKFKYKEKCNV